MIDFDMYKCVVKRNDHYNTLVNFEANFESNDHREVVLKFNSYENELTKYYGIIEISDNSFYVDSDPERTYSSQIWKH
jgi:hypothetical protein